MGAEERLGDEEKYFEVRVRPLPMLESWLNCGLAFERSRESWETQEGRTEVAALVLRCAGCKKKHVVYKKSWRPSGLQLLDGGPSGPL